MFSSAISRAFRDLLMLSIHLSGSQPHLVKCFENVKQLMICKQEIGPSTIRMLMSAEGEGLVLHKYAEYAANLAFRPLKPSCFTTSEIWFFMEAL